MSINDLNNKGGGTYISHDVFDGPDSQRAAGFTFTAKDWANILRGRIAEARLLRESVSLRPEHAEYIAAILERMGSKPTF